MLSRRPGERARATNPQIAAANDNGATNSIPDFISASGPVREVRFPFLLNNNGSVSQTADGGVHDLFTIAGRSDAPGCNMAQPDFSQMEKLGNLITRIPTPVFGAGLIENIPEGTIYANMAANAALKQSLGIAGHPNLSGNDGTVTRFGWKAQNKSLEIFAGEAYNVEMGVTNELFPEERSLPPVFLSFQCNPRGYDEFSRVGCGHPERRSSLFKFHALSGAPRAIHARYPRQSFATICRQRPVLVYPGPLQPVPYSRLADGDFLVCRRAEQSKRSALFRSAGSPHGDRTG